MSRELEEIRDGLHKFSMKRGPAAIMPALVKAVNEDDNTISVVFSDEVAIDDVRLRSVVKNGNKVVKYPKLESVVLVGAIENSDEYACLAMEEVDKVLYVIDNAKVETTADGHLIQVNNTKIETTDDSCLIQKNNTKVEVSDDGVLVSKSSETLKKIMDDLLNAIMLLTVNTNVGPSSVPVNVTDFVNIKTRVDQFLL